VHFRWSRREAVAHAGFGVQVPRVGGVGLELAPQLGPDPGSRGAASGSRQDGAMIAG
jgi:hypothetical protein